MAQHFQPFRLDLMFILNVFYGYYLENIWLDNLILCYVMLRIGHDWCIIECCLAKIWDVRYVESWPTQNPLLTWLQFGYKESVNFS